MQDILAACEKVARENGQTRITKISLIIGELTEVQDFALEFAFEALTSESMAAGAELDVTYLAPESRCKVCEHTYQHDRFTMLCPQCGSFEVELLHGRELAIDSIEAEEE